MMLNGDGGLQISYGSLQLSDGALWSGDLEHDRLPEEVAVYFAKNGDPGQRYGVASNERAPQHVLRRLLDDLEPGVWGSVLMNRATSTETLEIAASLHPDSDGIIGNHLNASTERMRRLRGSYVVGAQFDVFFERVSASEAERALLHKAIDELDNRATLGAAWDTVRPPPQIE
ncbi:MULTISPECIES: hypothetical protein [unclassified Cryobacterium]|uniref:hypothetical protein n=1 Tax=unclassified Cryobacterium TaxID=2649013 RepID=UPI00106CD29A|nr:MULTISPECIES: hypothetical protein [unclassified Cryobacterium]TFC55231.1 hypothetical protein E3O68_07155 [Cryobacterium sp. TMB3-1-2]TFC71168.1 hypothetical protein E3T21_08890 [Cryobacterium sp. TMB3-15]TFC77016.1 hypothetical protein E3T22_06945 [Cryobacterium sp. TMB3-10]TFC87763.1 hypothetical protein E3T19_11570 [Cryobacterium sp. TMT4-31]TFD46761.1 hypothetical protein E3T58_00560 [Cryobacterium sp. TMB3-12]